MKCCGRSVRKNITVLIYGVEKAFLRVLPEARVELLLEYAQASA